MPKSKYETHVAPYLEEIEAWARNGVSDKDIAHNLHVAYSSFRLYKQQYPALSAVLARTKEYVDRVVVEGAFLRRVTGYDATELRREYKVAADPETGEEARILVKEIEQTRHIPGDPAAMMFWLANRQSGSWKYRPQGEDTDDDARGVVLLPPVTEGGNG